MSLSILEQLEKKTIPKKKKKIGLILDKGQIIIDSANIIDKTQDNAIDISVFRKKIKKIPVLSAIPKTSTGLSKIGESGELGGESQTAIVSSIRETQDEKKIPVTTPPEKTKQKLTLPGKTKKTRKPRAPTRAIEEVKLTVPATLIQVNDEPIQVRLKPKDPSVNIKPTAYYMNNREVFVNFINSIFRTYGKKANKAASSMTCDSLIAAKKSKDFSLMVHQQIIRDYINVFSPYRGLLLYHGLGAGKTCGSIAIAEGLKNFNKVIVMTPASLRTNYIEELKSCGDPIYKKNQYWEKILTNGNKHIEKALSEVLGITTRYIRKNKGAWLVDTRKNANYKKLTPEEQKQVNNQIDKMIQNKYKFISYNGLRDSHLTNLEQEAEQEHGRSNPFDHKVVIIDEAHNFVSRIVNKISKKKSSLSTKLYEYLMDAEDCRVVFLTGTPIINYPNEIGILFNMLRGYIKTYYFNLDTSESEGKVNQARIMEIFKKDRFADYIEYRSSSNTLIITKNPFEFVSRRKKSGVYAGVSKNNKKKKGNNKKDEKEVEEESVLRSETESFKNTVIKRLRRENIKVLNPYNIKVEKFKALPDNLDAFTNLFIQQSKDDINIKNINLFKRRVLGLTSYFRSAQESLLPRFNEERDIHIENLDMSDFQLGIYEDARKAERKEETRNAKKRKKGGDDGGIYGETSSTYRIFSRAYCNFVFPNELVEDDEGNEFLLIRPMPKDGQNINDLLKKTKKDDESKTAINKSIMDEDILDGADIKDKLDNMDGRFNVDDVETLEEDQKEIFDSSYAARKTKALKMLEKYASKYFSAEGLKKYSPKFLKVLQNLQNHNHPGLHLIYTQFRTIEGIGILKLVLEHNGFAQFKLKKESGIWDINISDENVGKPCFALYTGTETTEEKELIRLIYNGAWEKLPRSLSKRLKSMHQNNNMGEIIKILMITSSGSEGIDLKNTRYVHIMEPYWHPVRTDQVIGRARRICSHNALDEEFKTVEVFKYLMNFTEKQLKGDVNAKKKEEREPKVSMELKIKDVSKIDNKTPLTSDQALFEISRIKKNISKGLLRAIKETSMDCSIHNKANAKEGLICYTFSSPSENAFSYKKGYTTEEQDVVSKINRKKVQWKGYKINIQGISYAIRPDEPSNKKIGKVYDFDSYQSAKKTGSAPILVGKTQLDPKTQKVKFIAVEDRDF